MCPSVPYLIFVVVVICGGGEEGVVGAVQEVGVDLCGEEDDLLFCGLRFVRKVLCEDAERVGCDVVAVVDPHELAHQPDDAGARGRVGGRVESLCEAYDGSGVRGWVLLDDVSDHGE